MKYSFCILFFAIVFSVASAQTNTFPSSGNVGIGTLTPSLKLAVEGPFSARATFSAYTKDGLFSQSAVPSVINTPHQRGILFGYGDFSESGGYSPRIGLQQDHEPTNSPLTVTSKSSIGLEVDGAVTINNGGLNTERVRITHDGNVGIGTVAPNAKLAVNGIIRGKEIKVEVANWPDYVFEDDYQLKPLQDLEAFIKINKHLPAIPPQAVVKEEGVALGEMNKKLLQKIEELTLYVIELNKKIVAHTETKNLCSH